MNERGGDTPTGKALAMLSAFASVGARIFDLTLTDLAGASVKGLQRHGRSLEDMRRTIGRVLYDAERSQHNVIIRPRSATALLIQLDDFTAEKAAQVEPLAFMTVCTSPGSYQIWLAVSDLPSETDKEAAKQFRTRVRRGAEADQSATGAVRIAGKIENTRRPFRPSNSPQCTPAGPSRRPRSRTPDYWHLAKNPPRSRRPVFLPRRNQPQHQEPAVPGRIISRACVVRR
jgi:hypothetical protein